MYSFHNWNDYWWLGGFFSVLVIVALASLLKNNCKHTQDAKKDEAMEILRKKYAAGEINKEEFEQKKKDLQ